MKNQIIIINLYVFGLNEIVRISNKMLSINHVDEKTFKLEISL